MTDPGAARVGVFTCMRPAAAYASAMRDFLIFVILVLIAFFAIGETVGWQLGIPGQTPVYVYKKDGLATAERRTIRRNDMPISLNGRVRDGSVHVRVIYQDLGSFQTNRQADPAEVVYEETFHEGQTIALERLVDEGAGEYRLELRFSAATGLFRMPMPTNSEL